MRRGLPEGEAEQRAALLGDVAEVIRAGGGVEGGGQADVADHVLAVMEAGHGPQDDDGGQRRQGSDAWVDDEAWGIRVGQGRGRDRVVELADLRVEAREQLEALIPAPGRVRGEREGLQLRQADLTEKVGATGESGVEGNGMQAIPDHGADADEAHAVHREGSRPRRVMTENGFHVIYALERRRGIIIVWVFHRRGARLTPGIRRAVPEIVRETKKGL